MGEQEKRESKMFFMVLNTEDDISFVEQLYNKYAKFMYKTAYGVLHNAFDAEDAVQQTLLKIIDKFGQLEFSDEKKTRNLIGIICRNVSIDIYNKKKRIFPAEEYDEKEEEGTPDLSVIIISKENMDKLTRFIYDMDDIYRDIVLLKAQSMGIAEISDILDISADTARKRLERARRKITEFLDGEKKYE